MHRVHVLKIPTTRKSDRLEDNLFPYTHYADVGHDPWLEVLVDGSDVVIRCSDRMKLHPNYMTRPANRADIYMPGYGATSLAMEIVSITGPGDVPELAGVDPEGARTGPQALPLIRETRSVFCSAFRASIAGCVIESGRTQIYIDNEEPKEGFVEMVGLEVHLGIRLDRVWGELDRRMVKDGDLWSPSSRHLGSAAHGGGGFRPAPTADAVIEIRLGSVEAAALAACLLHYAQAHKREIASRAG